MLKSHLPVLEWLSHYRLAWLRDDLIAGLTVWAVMAPTALAYTGIAGVPQVVGLYTGGVPDVDMEVRNLTIVK